MPHWSGALCSLNYERLLEKSLLHAGLKPFVGPLPDDDEAAIELCLPHGCCHLFCDGPMANPQVVSFNGRIAYPDSQVVVIADPQQHYARIHGNAFPPVMSYFEPAKTSPAGRTFIAGQRARWQELSAHADTLVIVGVRVRPHDAHIWQPVAACPGQVIYCSGPQGAIEYAAWANAARAGNVDLVCDGFFREEFERLCEEVGLCATRS